MIIPKRFTINGAKWTADGQYITGPVCHGRTYFPRSTYSHRLHKRSSRGKFYTSANAPKRSGTKPSTLPLEDMGVPLHKHDEKFIDRGWANRLTQIVNPAEFLRQEQSHSPTEPFKALETCLRQFHAVRAQAVPVRRDRGAVLRQTGCTKPPSCNVKNGTPLAGTSSSSSSLCFDALVAKAGSKHPEQELCVTPKLHPTGWWDADGYLRGKVDLTILQPERKARVRVVDYKTGKDGHIDTDQL